MIYKVHFPSGKTERYEIDRIYNYKSAEDAKYNSGNFNFCRAEVDDKWVYYYRWQVVTLEME